MSTSVRDLKPTDNPKAPFAAVMGCHDQHKNCVILLQSHYKSPISSLCFAVNSELATPWNHETACAETLLKIRLKTRYFLWEPLNYYNLQVDIHDFVSTDWGKMKTESLSVNDWLKCMKSKKLYLHIGKIETWRQSGWFLHFFTFLLWAQLWL